MSGKALADGRYVLERRLGSGGMGTVMLARDTALDRPVAVKLLGEHLAGDRELRERFLREGRFAAQLSHPNVVAVYDTGEDDGRPYIVMECVEGTHLGEEVERRGPLPAAEVVELGRQACAGLEHAHGRGLVHRDVKPQNLLLRSDGTLKVSDFGIARAGDGTATLTEAGTVLGTAAYIAPELVEGEQATRASDLYALGAVLYELATGRPPRRVATIAQLGTVEPLTPPSSHQAGIPPHLEEAIMRCLASDPASRPGSARQLAHELEEPTAGTTTFPDRPTEVLARIERTRFDRRVWLALAGVLASLAAALALVLVLPNEDSAGPPPVEPVPASGDPAQDARSLAAWLRENAEGP